MLSLTITGCSIISESDGDGGTYKDKAIQNVRSSLYNETTTYDEIIDAYLINPDWTAFNSDKDAPVVEVNGISVEKEDICIQFIGELGLGFHLVEKQQFRLRYFEVDGKSVDAEEAMEYIYQMYFGNENTGEIILPGAADEETLPDVTVVPTESGKRELVATYIQVGAYVHDLYSELQSEYVPTVYIYDDNTFEFSCNFYEYMFVYEGTWQLQEEGPNKVYHCMVENEPAVRNLDFYISHHTYYCDAEFITDYSSPEVFGMTAVDYDVIAFHKQ